MEKQPLPNQKRQGRGMLCMSLLTMLMAMLAPQIAQADDTFNYPITFTGLTTDENGGRIVTSNVGDWILAGGTDVTYDEDSGLGFTLGVNSTATLTSTQTFSGVLSNSIAVYMKYDNAWLKQTVYKMDATGMATALNDAQTVNGNDYSYYILRFPSDNLTQILDEHMLQLTLTTNTTGTNFTSKSRVISNWKGMDLQFSEKVSYGLTVGGYSVTNLNCADIDGQGHLSYDPETHTLTLNDYQPDLFEETPITTQLTDLKVFVRGYNVLDATANEQVPVLRMDSPDATLTFQTDEDEPGTLYLNSRYTEPISGTGLTINYENELANRRSEMDYYYSYHIAQLDIPQMFANSYDGQTTLDFEPGGDEEGVSIHFGIDYVSEALEDVADAVYDPQNPYYILGPCTVTAYTQMGDTKSGTVTGKYFGFAENPLDVEFTGQPVEVEAPALVPAPGADDGVSVGRAYEVTNRGVAYLGQSQEPTVFNVGTTDVHYVLNHSDNVDRPYTVLNNNYISVGDNEYADTLSLTLRVNYPEYGMIVYTAEAEPRPIYVTKTNHDDVLGDGSGSVRFDGYMRLVLENATLSHVELLSQNMLQADKGLEVYLYGDNTIGATGQQAFVSNLATLNLPLNFATSDVTPGRLTCTLPAAGGQLADAFQGFSPVECKNNLEATLNGEATVVTIQLPLAPIVDDNGDTEQGTEVAVDYASTDSGVTTGNLSNFVVDNVLYTLNDTQTAGAEDDGYDDGQVVLNSTMTDDAVAALTAKPGTAEYAEAFKGLTFMVPAGMGTVTVDAETADGYEFHLKVGSQDPVTVVSNNTDDAARADVIAYACTENTYVHLYLTQATAQSAPQRTPHRIGPKSGVSGGLKGLGVASSSIEAPARVPAEYKRLTAVDITMPALAGGNITISDAEVTDLDDNLFAATFTAAAPRRAAASADITYIDLTATAIVGMNVSRTAGAFAGVPESTFIYMPAGNTTTEKNVVIGNVCEQMVLNGEADNDRHFEVARAFTAAKAMLERPLTKDVTTTVCLPFAVTKPEEVGAFYELKSFDAKVAAVKMRPAAAVEANQAYILKPAATAATIVRKMAEVKPLTAGPLPTLAGTYEQKQAESGMYNYKPGEGTSGQFVPMESGDVVVPFSAYLRATGATADAIAIRWNGDKPVMMGDVNGSNDISITDAVGIVNYILGNPSADFDWEAADLSGDGNITITDAVGVVNLILNGDTE